MDRRRPDQPSVNYASSSVDNGSGRSTRNTISSLLLKTKSHHRILLYFYLFLLHLARTNALRSYRRRMSEVCRRSRPPLQQHERNEAFPSNAAASAVRSVKLNDQRRARKKITEVGSAETDAQNVIRSFETNTEERLASRCAL